MFLRPGVLLLLVSVLSAARAAAPDEGYLTYGGVATVLVTQAISSMASATC